MSDEEAKAQERQAVKEFPAMERAFSEVRERLIISLLATGLGKADERERLYLTIQNLDAVKLIMERYLSAGSIDIAAHLKELAEGEKPTT